MTMYFPQYDVTKDDQLKRSLDFNSVATLKHVDRAFKAEILNVIRLTEMEKLFQIRVIDEKERELFSFLPGQFTMVEVPGYGEMPISISSSESRKGYVELCVRNAGLVSGVLHNAQRGAVIGLRGPFGTHFPMDMMKGHNVLLIAGGLGLAPLRSAIYHVIENRAEFKDAHILYGARQPDQLLFAYQYDEWRQIDDMNIQIIVEHPDANWKGPVGLITKLLEDIRFDPLDTYALVIGPPVMFKFVCNQLRERGIPMQRMFVSLERRMHCGMGKCCRCNVGSTFTCVDGPVFDYWSVINLIEAI
ncbi:MAG: FAD/NAD(P)-binding protein [Thermodesulfobacteriota bacterium]|jgi:NAD(P)H-flavin reductase